MSSETLHLLVVADSLDRFSPTMLGWAVLGLVGFLMVGVLLFSFLNQLNTFLNRNAPMVISAVNTDLKAALDALTEWQEDSQNRAERLATVEADVKNIMRWLQSISNKLDRLNLKGVR